MFILVPLVIGIISGLLLAPEIVGSLALGLVSVGLLGISSPWSIRLIGSTAFSGLPGILSLLDAAPVPKLTLPVFTIFPSPPVLSGSSSSAFDSADPTDSEFDFAGRVYLALAFFVTGMFINCVIHNMTPPAVGNRSARLTPLCEEVRDSVCSDSRPS